MRAALFAAALFAASGAAASPAAEKAQQQAYDYAMKCFIANGIAIGDWREVGKPAEATAQEAKARRSFDAAVQLGSALGYSGERVNQDFVLARAQELRKMMTDRSYFRQTVAACKTIDLM